MLDLSSILDELVDVSTKGIPGLCEPFAVGAVRDKNWSVLAQDMPLPLLVLKRTSLDHNATVFQHYVDAQGVSFAPHGKTTMCPQIFEEQLRQGAWAMTAATINQVQVYRQFGIDRIILANQLVGKAHIEYIVNEIQAHPEFEFYCLIDSLEQIDHIKQYAGNVTRPINVLVEIGLCNGRTGIRELSVLSDVVRAVIACPSLSLCGLELYEGVVHEVAEVKGFLTKAASFIRLLKEEGLIADSEMIVSAGGSLFFDLVLEAFKPLSSMMEVNVVLRSGCYIAHDSGFYEQGQQDASQGKRQWVEPLKPALEVWSYVQSMPERGLAILSMGKRDCSYDIDLPCVLHHYRPGVGFLDSGLTTGKIVSLDDQHAYLEIGEVTDLRIGDMVGCGISHPCTSFDKWKYIPVVDDDYRVISLFKTFF